LIRLSVIAIHTGYVEWILLSNYNEFRLYNYYEKTDYISFNTSELKDDEILQLFLLVFSKESHLDKDYINKVKQETQIVERTLENEFYKLYNETRLMLTKELEEHNDFDKVKAVHYAQLILNRYMFICFAENIDLLPSQVTIGAITAQIKVKNVKRNSIWYSLNDLFMDINEGNEEKEIFEYNGGLFKEDIGFLKIRDLIDDYKFFKDTHQNWKFEGYSIDIENLVNPYNNKINPIYKNLLTISSFDFSSDLDVNILGHIFENSIGDIEELKADAKGRRKKEGVFYTPEYITDYICRNTIIPYLSKSGKANTVEKLLGEFFGSTEIEKLDKKVKEIKIVDPACGSGAFLNKAADILLEIHNAVHKALYDKKGTLDKHFDPINERRKILLDNIYGVDLNEESVEITKPALFLKVSPKDLKLPNLDNNIKCGNSIVDDPEYTDKPFVWVEEFKEVFKEGGFNIVIGNLPYVGQEKIKEIKPYLKEKYEVYAGTSDLYSYFFEKGIKILKNNGMFSFISANKFTRTMNDKLLRKFILKHNFLKYIDYTGKKVFEDATTNPCVIVIKKERYDGKTQININDDFNLEQNKFDEGIWSFYHPSILSLIDKIRRKGILIKEIPELKIYRGILTDFDKVFIIDEDMKNKFISKNKANMDLIKPLARGKDIKRYKSNYEGLYIIVTPINVAIDKYIEIKEHLSQFKEKLKKRYDKGNNWWELRPCKYYEDFKKEKIIWGNLSIGSNFGYSENELYITAPANMLTGKNIKYLLTVLNSGITNFYFGSIGAAVDSGYVEWKKNRIEQLPIYPATPEEQNPFIEKADQMLKLNKDLMNEINGFKDWLKNTFKIEKFSKKLDKYYELSFDEFLSELKKKKVDIKSRKNYTFLKKEFEEFQKVGEDKTYFADPLLIAMAISTGCTILTDERRRNSKRSIPYVCRKLEVKCMDLTEFMIDQGWKW